MCRVTGRSVQKRLCGGNALRVNARLPGSALLPHSGSAARRLTVHPHTALAWGSAVRTMPATLACLLLLLLLHTIGHIYICLLMNTYLPLRPSGLMLCQ